MVYREPEGNRFFKGGRDREDSPDAPAFPAENGEAPAAGAPPPGAPQRPAAELGGLPPRNAAPAGLGGPPPFAGLGRGEIETVVGSESSFDGKLRSEHSIRVQGEARGEIESKQAIYVEEGARVSAKMTASEITIAGQVEGQIYSVGRVEIRPSGQVNGEIHAASLVMQEGAFFDGQLKMKNRGRPEESVGGDREVGPSAPTRRLPSLNPSSPLRSGLTD